jgi:hypothetical protein
MRLKNFYSGEDSNCVLLGYVPAMLLLLIEELWYGFVWLHICTKVYENQFFDSTVEGGGHTYAWANKHTGIHMYDNLMTILF